MSNRLIIQERDSITHAWWNTHFSNHLPAPWAVSQSSALFLKYFVTLRKQNPFFCSGKLNDTIGMNCLLTQSGIGSKCGQSELRPRRSEPIRRQYSGQVITLNQSGAGDLPGMQFPDQQNKATKLGYHTALQCCNTWCRSITLKPVIDPPFIYYALSMPKSNKKLILINIY